MVLYATHDQLESIQKVMVHFYERLEFAMVPYLNKNNRPLVLYSYNFEAMEYEKAVYPSTRLGDYQMVKDFLEKYAAKRQFTSYELLAFPSSETLLATPDNATRAMYGAQLWTIVYEGPRELGEAAIQKYRAKYEDFLQYVLVESAAEPALYFGKEKTKSISLEEPDLAAEGAYIAFSKIEDSLLRMLQVPETFMIVEPSLLHLCSITQLEFFSNFLYCVATTESDVPLVKQKYHLDPDLPLAVLIGMNKSGVETQTFTNHHFKSVVREAYYTVFPKIKMMARMFIANPLFSSPPGRPYQSVCPSLCMVYLHDTQSPNREELRALREASYKYSNEISFVQSDFRCHHDLLSNISRGKEKPKMQKVLIFYSNNTVFAYREKVTQKVVDKILKLFKTAKLKMKPLAPEAQTDEHCPYQMESLDELLGQSRVADDDDSESATEQRDREAEQPGAVADEL